MSTDLLYVEERGLPERGAAVEPATELSSREAALLLTTVFIVAICGIVYELVIGTISSYLLGNSVTHFSITIGLFLSAMGIGSFLSSRFERNLLHTFMLIEMGVGLVGGGAALLLYGVFATSSLYYVAMTLLLLLLGSLIGMEIPLLTRIMGDWDSVKQTLATVLGLDYLGALLASILFPIVLLPQLGLLNTAFATGMLNMLVVGINLWIFRAHLQRVRLLAGAAISITALLIAGMIWSNGLLAFFESRLYDDDVIYTKQTAYQRIVMTRWATDLRLYLDGELQFSSADEYRYHEPLVHPAMSLSSSRESVLILGGGDGLVAREVLKYQDVERVILVDIDPAMTQLAQTHHALLDINEGALSDPRVEIMNRDAYRFLTETSELYGVILLDLPDPNNEGLGKLYSREFYKLVKRHLAKGGIWASQATSPYFAREAYWSIVHTASDRWAHIQPYHVYVPTFGDWGFFLAADHSLNLNTYSPEVPYRYFSPELFATSQLFDADTAKIETEVNTLDNQIILRYYEMGWKRWN